MENSDIPQKKAPARPPPPVPKAVKSLNNVASCKEKPFLAKIH